MSFEATSQLPVRKSSAKGCLPSQDVVPYIQHRSLLVHSKILETDREPRDRFVLQQLFSRTPIAMVHD